MSSKKGIALERHYAERNVDLALLGKWIEQLFQKKGFIISKDTETTTLKIIARPTHVHDIVDNIIVRIAGDPNDFKLKFNTGERSEALMKLGTLSQWIGGGILFLRGAKSQEVEDRLEDDFWAYVEEKIDFLTNSAGKTREK